VERSVSTEQEFVAADDVRISPTYVPDLVDAALDLLIDGERGIWHLSNQGEVSWFDFAHQFIRLAGLNESRLRKAPLERLPLVAPRPYYSVLSSERGLLLPHLENALFRFVQVSASLVRE
jgi:dTDP-4-dehydrorhamnose reductase